MQSSYQFHRGPEGDDSTEPYVNHQPFCQYPYGPQDRDVSTMDPTLGLPMPDPTVWDVFGASI